jgi:hypothetical protein
MVARGFELAFGFFWKWEQQQQIQGTGGLI